MTTASLDPLPATPLAVSKKKPLGLVLVGGFVVNKHALGMELVENANAITTPLYTHLSLPLQA